MKLNNKGFAISSILYSILIMAIMLILGVLFSLFNRKIIFDKLKHDVINELDSNINLSIAKINVDPVLFEITSNPNYNVLDGITASETKNGVTTDLTNNILYRVYDANGKDVTDGFIASIPGRYTIKYDVIDSNNNMAETKSRVLVVDDYSVTKGVNAPVLAKGMTPIKWNGTTWVDTTVDDNDWYSYDTTNKKWANVRTADGSMWVWIPRYIYKITPGWHLSTTGTIAVQFSKGTNDNWNSSVIGNINKDTTANASNNSWTNHPGFTVGTTQVTGIWVAKFEATAVEGVVNGYTADGTCPSGSDDVTNKTIQVLPNKTSWRCISVGNIFTTIRNMETKTVYGWNVASGLQANGSFTTDTNNINTHMMKNMEWGAVTYLSKSNYGQGTNEIWINPANNFTTGCAGDSVSSISTTGCLNAYNTTNGVNASTTGNIYGIYDISGCSWEYTAAYVNNGNGNLSQGSSITSALSQYKDVYTVGSTDDQANNYALAVNKKGDAVWEISNNINGAYSWFGDNSYMPYTNSPWFVHGGWFGSSSLAGPFNFYNPWGGADSRGSFHPVLVVGLGF